MTIQGIDHIELYVGDARQTAYFLCTAFGFRIRGQAAPRPAWPNSARCCSARATSGSC